MVIVLRYLVLSITIQRLGLRFGGTDLTAAHSSFVYLSALHQNHHLVEVKGRFLVAAADKMLNF